MEKEDKFDIVSVAKDIIADQAVLNIYYCALLYLANDRLFDVWVRSTLAYYRKGMFKDEKHAREILNNCKDYLNIGK